MTSRLLCSLAMFLVLARTSCASDISLKEDGKKKWRRGNMHTHSLWSDGDDYPEMIASWYKERDYDFLVFTDHNVLLRGDRWIDVEKNKGGRAAFDKLVEKFSGDWVQTRTEKERQQVKLKTFDQVFERLAKPQEFLLIQGEEITDRYKNLPVHMCARRSSRYFAETL